MERHYSPKTCIDCGVTYMPTSNRQLRCPDCKHEKDKEACRQYHARTYVRKGYNQKGANNNAWKGGVAAYRTMLQKTQCAICGSTEHLLIHHIDHDRSNNDITNLVVWCKRCHQEHHCERDEYGRYKEHS